MTNFVYIATSVDGFIAKRNGDISWLENVPQIKGEDYGYSKFMKNIDAIILGRNTFEKVLTFKEWPYKKPVFVISKTITQLPKKFNGKVELTSSKPIEVIHYLNKKGYKNLYIDGGKTIQSFLKEGLIDELIITKIPIILGDGIPLFSNTNETTLILLNNEVFSNGLVKSHYAIKSTK